MRQTYILIMENYYIARFNAILVTTKVVMAT